MDKCRHVVAAALLWVCDMWFGLLKQLASSVGFAFSVHSFAWDETTECLSMQLHPSLCKTTVKSSWHVLVSAQSFSLGLADGRVLTGEINRPVVPLVSTSSGSLNQGLWSLRLVKRYSDFVGAMTAASKIHIHHFDRDGASSNDRLVAWRQGALYDESVAALSSDMTCGNHRTNLIQCSIIMASFSKVVASLYSMCLFLRMGGYWMRLIHSLPKWLAQPGRIRLLRGQPPSSCKQSAAAIRDYT